MEILWKGTVSKLRYFTQCPDFPFIHHVTLVLAIFKWLANEKSVLNYLTIGPVTSYFDCLRLRSQILVTNNLPRRCLALIPSFKAGK